MSSAYIGQGVAFAALVAGAVTMEVNDKNAAGLWMIIVFWWAVTDWIPKN